MSSDVSQLWVFAGPNGTGKSTLASKYLRDRIPIVNPDEIALGLGRDESGQAAVLHAGKIALKPRMAFMALGASFAIETTLSGNSEIRLMRDACAAGYKVSLVYVGVRSAEVSERCVAHRVRMGLHSVPTEDIVRRFPRSMENLPVAMGVADRSVVVDNTGKGFRLLLVRESAITRIIARKQPAWVLKAVPEELR